MKSQVRNFRIIVLSLMVTMNFETMTFIQPQPLEGITHVKAERAQSGSTYTVDRLTDGDPNGGGEGSGQTGDLRYAVTHAQSGDKVIFSVIGEIKLSSSLLLLTKDMTIQGPDSGALIVHGNGGSVFSVWNGTTVILTNLMVTGGIGNGGGIFNRGTLTLNNVTVSYNRAGDLTNGGGTGAGIWNYINGNLTLNNSTVSGNSVFGNSSYNPSRGGGIANYGVLTLNNSTVSGNSASEGAGGGISNTLSTSILTLNNSTVSGNSAIGAAGIGGGIDNRGTLNSSNTIIAGNTRGDLQGALVSQGHNLIGSTTGGGGYRPDLGDLLDMNPLLDMLKDNGGFTQTHALLAGSPAIDQGDNASCPGADQRGYSRPEDGDGDGTAVCDIGAYEVDGVPLPHTPTTTPGVIDTLTPTSTDTPVPTTEAPSNTPSFTPTMGPVDTFTPTFTSVPAPTNSPTPTPTPPVPPCSGAVLLVMATTFLMRSSSKRTNR